jgi:RND family efflux transporter MFP subunit
MKLGNQTLFSFPKSTRRKRLGVALGFGAALLIPAILAGCGRAVPEAAPPPPAVTVAPVDGREVVEWDEFTGRTVPIRTVEVRPRVSGYIQEVRFQSGQLVKKGEVLFIIDPRWHQAEFDRRQAEYDQANVHLDNAKREADRSPQLLKNQAISAEEAEARQARYKEAQAAALAAQAARDFARLDLDYTQIRAPIDGRVSREMVTEGNYVSGIAGNATLLTTIVSLDRIYVYADIDENSLLKFNALMRANKLASNNNGQIPVELELADEKQFPHHGTIESFDNHLDPQSGSILLRAVFPNPDGRIMPGLFARIRIPASQSYRAVLVEERAIGTDQSQKFVYTLTRSNTVEFRPVRLGPAIRGKRVVREGLAPGEVVVVNGLQRLRPGISVTAQAELAGPDNDAELQTAQGSAAAAPARSN